VRLTDLDPRWLEDGGQRIGLVFKCPHCQKCYVSCFNRPTKKFDRGGDDGDTFGSGTQFGQFQRVLGRDEAMNTVPCKSSSAWTIDGDFGNMTIKPSLDASAAGHWHGFVTNGQIC
jgi:hypothetical protein